MPAPFLDEHELRPVVLKDSPFGDAKLALGPGASGLEVVFTQSTAKPRGPQVRNAWRTRHAGRAAPVLFVVVQGDKAALCGPSGDEPPLYENVDRGQAERICKQALSQVDRHAAIRYLRDALPSVQSKLPGVRNEGFLATYELQHGARKLAAWAESGTRSKPLLPKRGEEMLKSLGFHVERCDQVTSILRTAENGQRVAVAVLLKQNESPELQTERFSGMSPVSYALAVANRESLPYMILQQGARLRLYPVKLGVGVGRRGPSDTYLELHTDLLQDEDSAYLWLLFSAAALAESGTLEQLLDESKRFAGELAEKLRNRIYDEVVPRLAQGLALARGIKKPKVSDLRETYEMAMITLFRLLFIAYAEDKSLLPYEWNSLYRNRSLKQKARDLLELYHQGTKFDEGHSLWDEVIGLFHAVRDGQREWGIPKYNGGLFSNDPAVSKAGALLEDVTLPNTVVGHVLHHLLLVGTPEGLGPVDFRSLGVREFGTVYEGLLESELAVAETDLTIDSDGFYRPAEKGEEIKAHRAHVYLHNRSGARKASGTYFTKPFAVDHLLDHALEPALDDHCKRLDALDEEAAATAMFDFRVADIAMGSGHFLVAAVDRIERKLSTYLSKRTLPGFFRELQTLRASAEKVLAGLKLEDQIEIEDAQLLRRLIARRCIYGVDINEIAVQLARLSIWIHTFVPGLPLSVLDHNLTTGNALVGIGTVKEIIDKAKEDDLPLFSIDAKKLIGEAIEPLTRLARIADTTIEDVERARAAIAEARRRTRPAEALCDIVTACRISRSSLPIDLEDWDSLKSTVYDSKAHRTAKSELAALDRLHFPVMFPEVFLRERAGFDVLVGNPPWDKVRFEEQQFWVCRSPGLNALPATRRDRAIEILRKERPAEAKMEEAEAAKREALQNSIDSAFVLQGRGKHGHHDLAKVFLERALQLVAKDGTLGYVLPRTFLVLGGWVDLREKFFNNSACTTLQARNTGGWLFDDVDGRLMITLVTRASPEHQSDCAVEIWPSIESIENLKNATKSNSIRLAQQEIETLTDSLVIPWFSGSEDRAVFDTMRAHDRLGGGKGWINAIADSSRWDFSGSGPHKVFAADKASAESWRVLMTRHVDAFRLDRDIEYQRFIKAPNRLVSLELGIEMRRGKAVIGANHPVIVYRYPTMNDNSRTLIATALPETGFLYSKGYAHGLRVTKGSITDTLALLGYLNSYLCDWWVRRFTDRHMTLPVLKNVPLPAWDDATRKQVADLTSRLLLNGDVKTLPGGINVESSQPKSRTELSIRTEIEQFAFVGFELPIKDFALIRPDFSEGGCPSEFVEALLKGK